MTCFTIRPRQDVAFRLALGDSVRTVTEFIDAWLQPLAALSTWLRENQHQPRAQKFAAWLEGYRRAADALGQLPRGFQVVCLLLLGVQVRLQSI